MGKPRVLCMTDVSGAPEVFETLGEVADVDYREPDRELLSEIIGQYDAFWGHVNLKVDAAILRKAQKLRVICTSSTGTDHIDKETAAAMGIRVLSITHDYKLLERFTATAELSWLLLLACCRYFRRADKHVMDGRWNYHLADFNGRQLSEMTMGVLGVGRLGTMTCRFARAVCPRVLGCDLKGVDLEQVEEVDFETLLRESDAISVHIHMLPQNYHLFNAKTFAMMKDKAILVNTSRGDIIDEDALLTSLKTGRLAAFGADVLHDEWREDMSQSPVVRYAQEHDNVVITPHIGGCTSTSTWGGRIFVAKKLAHYLKTNEELTMG